MTTRNPRLATTMALGRSVSPEPLPVVISARPTRSESRVSPAVRLVTGSCIVGAGQGADLLIADETVSRRHAKLTVVPEGVLIEDLDSRNGTYYLGHRVQSMIAGPGTEIMVGETPVRIDLDRTTVQRTQGPEHYGALLAHSRSMRELFAMLQRLEGSLVSILIQGESGTGKELLAQAIHEGSSVKSGPFVTVNCATLQANVVRSELFGHRNAVPQNEQLEGPPSRSGLGAFRAAHGGTLFLDEIGELPLDVQPMLLRALEDRAIVPQGASRAEPVAVRVIAATHHDLEQATALGTFRSDLYYRLNVVKLEVPPLRQRPEDIEGLAQHFARSLSGAELPADAIDALSDHNFPGNVRELRHAVECYLALGTLPKTAELPPAMLAHLPSGEIRLTINESLPYHKLKEQVMNEFTERYLDRLLARCGGNVSKAARISGLERSYLNKLALKFGLRQ